MSRGIPLLLVAGDPLQFCRGLLCHCVHGLLHVTAEDSGCSSLVALGSGVSQSLWGLAGALLQDVVCRLLSSCAGSTL